MSFHRTFKTVTYLLVLVGITALTVADGTPSYIILAFSAAALSWWVVEVKGRGLPKGATYILVGLLILFAVLDSLFISGAVLMGLAHLLVLVQVLKLFQVKENRDYMQMYAISFMHLLVASVLTTDFNFSLFFVAYLVLVTWALLLLHLKKSAENHHQDLQGVLNRRLFASTFIVIILAFTSTAIFFVLIPRVGMGLNIKSFKLGDLVSGFSERVELGDIGRIKKDSRVVMRVELINAKPGEGFKPLWRGKIYDYYSRGQWKSSASGGYELLRRYGEKIPVRLQVKIEGARVLKHKVQLEGMDSKIIFMADSPAAVIIGTPYLWAGPSGTVYTPGPHLDGIKYTAYSLIADRGVEYRDTPGKIDEAYLQLPPLSPRVRELAEKVVAGGGDNRVRADLIEAYLLKNYSHTLDLSMRPGVEPVEYFLFRRKKGNCEYFASAMVLMLRSIGIPARMVGGFRGGEWNRFGRYYLVRQSNAHTWVEAYLPPAGWLSFDPTPAEDGFSFVLPAFLKVFPRMLDALRWRWQSHIIAFDMQDQRLMYLKAARGARGLKKWSMALKDKLRRAAKPVLNAGAYLILALAVAAGVIAAMVALARKGFLPAAGSGGNGGPPLKFYRRYLGIMARKGFRKPPTMTPLEFARRTIAHGGEHYQPTRRVTDIYYRIRYGGGDADREELEEIRMHLSRLKEAPPR